MRSKKHIIMILLIAVFTVFTSGQSSINAVPSDSEAVVKGIDVAVIGNAHAGRRSLISVLTGSEYDSHKAEYESLRCTDDTKPIIVKDRRYMIRYWKFPNALSFDQQIEKIGFCQVVIIAIDTWSEVSMGDMLDVLEKHVPSILSINRKYPKMNIILVGTKIDLISRVRRNNVSSRLDSLKVALSCAAHQVDINNLDEFIRDPSEAERLHSGEHSKSGFFGWFLHK